MQRRRFTRLDRPERWLCGSAALCCFVSAFVLMPTGARSQFEPLPPSRSMTPARAATPLAAIAPARDAFAPQAVDADDERATPPPSARPMIAPLPLVEAARLTAIALGAHPLALVDTGTGTRMVTVGDLLNGTRIIAIDAAAVRFENGTRLELAPSADAR